jgi:hypothetical protein
LCFTAAPIGFAAIPVGGFGGGGFGGHGFGGHGFGGHGFGHSTWLPLACAFHYVICLATWFVVVLCCVPDFVAPPIFNRAIIGAPVVSPVAAAAPVASLPVASPIYSSPIAGTAADRSPLFLANQGVCSRSVSCVLALFCLSCLHSTRKYVPGSVRLPFRSSANDRSSVVRCSSAASSVRKCPSASILEHLSLLLLVCASRMYHTLVNTVLFFDFE